MPHTLKEVYRLLSVTPASAVDADLCISGITADSRQVQQGWMFVAERGVNVDGHAYIGKAIEAGAKAIVCERYPDGMIPPADVAWILVPDSAEVMGLLASWWYGHPSRRLTLIGVTGTNGKTTVATIIHDLARYLGEKAGLLSTVVNKVDDKEIPATHTTPDPLTINRLLAEMVEAGCTICAMEVSSHACAQKRIAGLRFGGGIFTNITRDHLDYHRTFANYLSAKKSFFDSLPPEAFALTNTDDRNGLVMLQNTKARRYTYSTRRLADFHGRLIEDRIDGMLMAFDGSVAHGKPVATTPAEVETAFVGAFNAANLTAVYGAALLVGWDRDEVLRAISHMHPVAGRMQTLRSSAGVTAVIDYAHTPDALANVLATLTEIKGTHRIITVFGAGGDRDKGKRPLMGAEAARYSDIAIVTSDNPRHEDPHTIALEILAGIPHGSKATVSLDLDRKSAILSALGTAMPGDIVLIAGKGHENYQIIGDTRHHFDDREVVREAFAQNTPDTYNTHNQ